MTIKSFATYIIEKLGQPAGNLELVKMTLADALKYVGTDVTKTFKSSFKTAKEKATSGWTVRKDMPVIRSMQSDEFYNRMKKGLVNFDEKTSKVTIATKPSPDNMHPVTRKKIRAIDLHPIQKQIYFDKGFDLIRGKSIKDVSDVLSKPLIVSSDNYIVDGHHRFLSAMLLDPNYKLNCVVVDLPISILLPLAVGYGDAIGNHRNK